MKRILIATALTLAAASSVSAMTSSTELSNALKYEIRTYVPNAQLDNLTSAQFAAINGLFTGSDNNNAGDNVRGQLKVILSQ